MPRRRTTKLSLAEALARPLKGDGRRRRYYDDDVRSLALRIAPGGERAFTLNERVIGKPPAMSLADARRIALGAGAEATRPIRYLEVCAGIGSASLAFESLGWRCAGMAEIDPKARAFLSQRFPDAKLLGDFRQITAAKTGRIDVLVGGTPCQSYSSLGRKLHDEDARGRLAFDFIDLAHRVGAQWFLFENVSEFAQSPAWGRWLRHADECGYHVAWRRLDLRSFGLPARRTRLFACGYVGGAEPAFRALCEPRRASWPHPAQAIAAQHRGPGGVKGEVRAIALNHRGAQRLTEFLPTLREGQPGYAGVLVGDVFRRFTIKELERCMGFPDGWTEFEWRGTPSSYRTRAAMLGNAFSPAVLNWLGGGISTQSSIASSLSRS